MLTTALAAGLSRETLRKTESGRVAAPASPTIAAIADVLGLSLDAVRSAVDRPDGAVELARSARDAGERLAA
jgi:transcriptional regulator with XRE-family HTH domain